MEKVKDPLGVVKNWTEEASGHHFTGWDDAKYGLGMSLLIGGLAVSPFLLIWALFF